MSMNPKFVDAYDASGRKTSIPRHWLDHPVLGRGWTLTPRQRTQIAADTARAPRARPATTPAVKKAADNPPATGENSKGAK